MRNSVEPERAEERMKRGPGPFMGGSYRRAAIVARPAGRFFPRPVPFDRRSEPDLGDDRPDESPGLRAGFVDTTAGVWDTRNSVWDTMDGAMGHYGRFCRH